MSGEPVVKIVDGDGGALTVDGTVAVEGLHFDGEKLKVDATITAGDITISTTHVADPDTDLEVNVKTDGTNNAMVVTQNAQPLPTGAATATKQDTGNTSLATIATNQTNSTQLTKITDGVDVAEVIAGANTGVKGLRVYNSPTDPISDISVGIDFAHHQVHEGETWEWFSFGALNATTKDIRISVGNVTATTRTPHLLPEVIADNTTTQIFLYEGTTWTAAGTDDSARIYNRNRNIAGAPTTKIYVTGATALTPNALGTQLYQGYLFTGKASANAERNLSEWILKTSTEYLFRVTTTGNGSVLIRLHWYEDSGV